MCGGHVRRWKCTSWWCCVRACGRRSTALYSSAACWWLLSVVTITAVNTSLELYALASSRHGCLPPTSSLPHVSTFQLRANGLDSLRPVLPRLSMAQPALQPRAPLLPSHRVARRPSCEGRLLRTAQRSRRTRGPAAHERLAQAAAPARC